MNLGPRLVAGWAGEHRAKAELRRGEQASAGRDRAFEGLFLEAQGQYRAFGHVTGPLHGSSKRGEAPTRFSPEISKDVAILNVCRLQSVRKALLPEHRALGHGFHPQYTARTGL